MMRRIGFVALCGLLSFVAEPLHAYQAAAPAAAPVAAPSAAPAATQSRRIRAAVASPAAASLPQPVPAEAQPQATPDGAAQATPAETPRLARLKTLVYDRRPSTIFRVWSEPAGAASTTTAAAGTANPAAPPADEEVAGGAVFLIADVDLASIELADAEEARPEPPAQPTEAATPAAAPTTEEQAALEAELKALQRNVTLGNWKDVKKYLAEIPAGEGKEGYAQMLRSLSAPPQNPNQQQGRGVQPEQHLFAIDDLIGLAAACPHALERATVVQLAPMVQASMQSGVLAPAIIARLRAESERPEAERLLGRNQCAWLLVATGMTNEIEPFLPPFDEALAAKDAEILILLAQCRSARYDRDHKPATLEEAWTPLQAVLSLTDAKPEQQTEALKMTIGLLPRIREGLGQAWLEKCFHDDPKFGMRIVATTGGTAADSLQRNTMNPAERLRDLKTQKTVVESLLKKAPERADQWQDVLRVLALAWLREAEITHSLDRSTSFGPRMQRDMYGNFFYFDNESGMSQGMMRQNNELRPITSAEMIEVAPDEAWLERLADTIRPKFLALHSQLYLKVGEDERAYPYIERLAQSQPDLARDLVHEFVRVWTRNHDMNANNRYTNPYMFMYGFEMRANSIPLTRSKQERNLDELAGWVKRIRQLPIKDLDEGLLARAFTSCHSTAEVYRIEAVEEVFGAIDSLPAKTLTQLVQQMRSNLGGIWRMPAQQEQQKTQRKQKDIEAEVLRGYDVAHRLVAGALQKYPDNWQLELAQACLRLDENTFRQDVDPTSKFSEQRLAALGQFRHAAELYATAVPALPEAEQEATVYEHWFYAGLGASDLGQIDHRATADPRQPALIREAIAALPGEAAEKHLSMFANALFTRMSGLKPTVKFPYLKAGFEIVGDHKQAREARKVYDYYKDLVQEIRLVTRVDGSAKVGHGAPFGVFVELLHTPEIERESGGFGKYLQNQNSMQFAWNYGRPLENYRDKFETAARAALDEHFEVVSVTFQDKDVHARSASDVGWRLTPYAYLLLKARGAEVDKLPSLKMDFDFLDTSGYAVLPINSSAVPLDAAPDSPDPRPADKLRITQTLDERQAKDGKLVLEVKATAQGLAPALDQIVNIEASDFEVKSTEDGGVLVSRFDPESKEPAIISERTWTIAYAGKTGLAELPKEFHFPEPNRDVAEIAYMRYEDADLKSVEPVVSLEQKYGEVKQTWPWVVGSIAGVVLLSGLGAWRWSKRPRTVAAAGVQLPDHLTPFNMLALLKRIESNNGFDVKSQQELAGSIQTLERYYFAGAADSQAEPDLQQLARRWVAKAR